MDWLPNILSYLNKDNLLPTTKRILNFVFVLVISNYLFEHYYYEYNLNEWDNFEANFEFIASGYFIIPFGIYFLVWSASNIFGVYLMVIINYLITDKFRSKIIRISITRNELHQQAEKINNLIEKQTSVSPKKEWFVTIYEQLKKSVSKDNYQQLIFELQQSKIQLEGDFVLFIRSFVAIILISNSSLVIGCLLLTLLVSLLVFFALNIIIKFQFAELFPVAIQKYSAEMEKYINEKYPQETTENLKQNPLESELKPSKDVP